MRSSRDSKSVKLLQKQSVIQGVLGNVFIHVLRDYIPTLNHIFVTRVELSPDLGSAHIFLYSSKETEESVKSTIKHLIKYIPLIRKHIAQETLFRRIPQILFYFDDVCKKTLYIEQLIDNAVKDYKDEE